MPKGKKKEKALEKPEPRSAEERTAPEVHIAKSEPIERSLPKTMNVIKTSMDVPEAKPIVAKV